MHLPRNPFAFLFSWLSFVPLFAACDDGEYCRQSTQNDDEFTFCMNEADDRELHSRGLLLNPHPEQYMESDPHPEPLPPEEDEDLVCIPQPPIGSPELLRPTQSDEVPPDTVPPHCPRPRQP